MTKRRVVVLGAGGQGKVVISTAEAAGCEVVGVFDDDERLRGHEILGHAVAGPLEAAVECGCDGAVIAVGHNRVRQQIAERLGLQWVTVVHPSAWVCDSASLGDGTVVFAHAVVQPEARLGCHVIINTSASVDHACEVGDYAHLAPGVHLGGDVRVGTGCLVGIGSVVARGVGLGAWSLVGAGSAVMTDVAPSTTVVGVPARILAR